MDPGPTEHGPFLLINMHALSSTLPRLRADSPVSLRSFGRTARLVGRGCLAALALSGLIATGSSHAQTLPRPVLVEVLSPSPIVVEVNRPLPQPIRVRVRDAQTGSPIHGAVVDVYINLLICLPLPTPPSGPTCEEYHELLNGAFGAGPDGPFGAQATTTAEGIATLPTFHSGVIVGSYQLIVSVSASNNNGLYQSPSPGVLLGITQVPTPPRTIPAANGQFQLLLGVLLALVGTGAIRRMSHAA